METFSMTENYFYLFWKSQKTNFSEMCHFSEMLAVWDESLPNIAAQKKKHVNIRFCRSFKVFIPLYLLKRKTNTHNKTNLKI